MRHYEEGVEAYRYRQQSRTLIEDISALKESLKEKIVILGHHYQRDDVIQFADVTGDSLILSQKAAEMDKKFIVFCGVYFMAECADILAKEGQSVYLPDLRAGCVMADMARRNDVETVWKELTALTDETIIPVTYINSTADIKAFVGKNNGIVCTSSNAAKVFDWAMRQGTKILFLPDRYLGANTALARGMRKEEIWLLNRLPDERNIRDIKVLLWDGYCSVHRLFSIKDVMRLREDYPGIQIIVHGECSEAVVQASDYFGSTSAIIKRVTESPEGSVWGIGTEEHLVRRLKMRFPEKMIVSLSRKGLQCSTMSMITPEKLYHVLMEIRDGSSAHRISVENEIKYYAKSALMRMLSL